MKTYILQIALLFLTIACGGGDSSSTSQTMDGTYTSGNTTSTDSTTDTSTDTTDSSATTDSSDYSDDSTIADAIFPDGLMAASPFADAPVAGSNRYPSNTSLRSSVGGGSGPAVPHYTWATERIGEILSGATPLLSAFDVAAFYRNTLNADCFAPSINYSGHPDASGGASASGQLPGGDLGIWLAESSDGNACVVSQTNQLLAGVQDQSMMSLMTIASMVSAINSAGMSLPTSMSSVSVTAEMNALGLPDINFTLAFITNNSSFWKYQVNFEYTVSGKIYDVTMTLDHTPGSTTTEYGGNLYYLVEGEQGVPSLNLPGGNCPSNERTRAGSLTYDREGDDMNLQARTATLCGHGVADAFNSNGLVDVDNRYTATSNSDGWSENFSIFGADFDITDITGEYTFAWQAGVNDGYSRIFIIGFNDTSLDNGEGHFGYGDAIQDTDGYIQGFICDWATPNGTRTLTTQTQRQFFDYDVSSAVYIGSDYRANIEYAPTRSCEYDGSGSFLFDVDASTVLGDITAEDVSLSFASDLWSPTDPAHTVPEGLQARGIRVPSVPSNWPADE